MDSRPAGRLKRYGMYVLLALYAVTWIWGIPSIHTAIAAGTIKSYKQHVRLAPDHVFARHPRLRFGASYAVLPLVTVSHYEYQVAALAGWGGFSVDVWYFTGSVTLFRWTKWVS